jgi:hypothetical protein
VQAAVPEDVPDPEPPAAAAGVELLTEAGVLGDDAWVVVAGEPEAAGGDDELQPAASTPAVRNVTASGALVVRRPSGGRVM